MSYTAEGVCEEPSKLENEQGPASQDQRTPGVDLRQRGTAREWGPPGFDHAVGRFFMAEWISGLNSSVLGSIFAIDIFLVN